MEMHADLVAVSLTGSDTLIYALHRLRTADDAWDRTLGFASAELAKGRVITDLFAVQSRVIDRMRHVLNAEAYRPAPSLPGTNRERFRVFSPELAQPPRMWSTHPANDEREANAKRVYIAAPGDDRSSWLIIGGADRVREQISTLVIGEHANMTRVDADAALRAIDEEFARPSLETRYRGIYLDRSTVRPAAKWTNLYGAVDGAADKLSELYPESLARDVERLRTTNREKQLLDAIDAGVLEAPGAIIRHRGRQLKRRELPKVIAQLTEEIARLQQKLWAHDRRVRTAHRAIAARLGRGWEEYLCGLGAALHYADHSDANIRDAHRALANRVGVATAGSRPGKKDIARVLSAAEDLYSALSPVFMHRTAVVLDATLAQRLGVTDWSSLFEEFKLNKPTQETLGDWLNVVDGWVSVATRPLGRLRDCALDQLLSAEAQLARCNADGSDPGDAPSPSRVPEQYPVILPGGERELQRKLTVWRRFQTADGPVPAAARFLVAASIVGAMLGFGGQIGEATINVYNGLGRPVTVTVGEQTVRAEAFSSASISLPPGVHHVTTKTVGGGKPVEAFDATVEHAFGNYVYNVARAGTLVEWTQVYGDAQGDEPRMIGAPRWTETSATTLFTDPPTSISTSGKGGRVVVLSGLAAESPNHVLGILNNERDEAAVIAAHARWDAPSRRYTIQWLSLAENRADFPQLVAARLSEDSHDIAALRSEQNATTGAAHDSVCSRHSANAAAAPDDPNLQYLGARCIADESARDSAFLALAERWPKNGWLASASGYTLAEEMRWEEALARLELAATTEPALRSTVAIDVARLRRMVHGHGVNLADVRAASEQLDMHIEAETDTSSENGSHGAYAALAQGELADAWRRSAGLARTRVHMLQYVGASDGADSSMIARALAAPLDSSMQVGDLWAHVALAGREGRDIMPYTEYIRDAEGERAEPFLQFVEILRTSRDPVKAEAALGRQQPASRGLAYSIGTVMLGSAAPAQWREGAKRLLFVTERPYFR
jgi:hypothetical protein